MKSFGARPVALAAALSCLVHCGGRTLYEAGDPESGGAGGADQGGTTNGGASAKGGARSKGGAPPSGGAPTFGGAPTKGGAPTFGGAPGCPPGRVSCGNACVDLLSDPNNCGKCGVACTTGACVMGVCQTPPGPLRSCLELQQRLGPLRSGYHPLDDGSVVYCDMDWFNGGWTRCLDFENTKDIDLDHNNWFDTCVDFANAAWNQGEVFVKATDQGGSLVYMGMGKRTRNWTYSQLTSTAVDTNQASVAAHEPIWLTSGDLLWVTGRNTSSGGCVGALANGYGLIITAPDEDVAGIRLMMMPYHTQIGVREPRPFGFDNRQWSPAHEISFRQLSLFDSCGKVPAFRGRLEFFVR